MTWQWKIGALVHCAQYGPFAHQLALGQQFDLVSCDFSFKESTFK
jgi:hypothetical protein